MAKLRTDTVGEDDPKKKVKKPIELAEVRVTAMRKPDPLTSKPDSMMLGRGSNQAKYAMDDIKGVMKKNPKLLPGADSSSKETISNSLYGKDNENTVMALIKAKKKK